ncbi:ABC transporter permease [Phytoactinopolyspora endophytica]|uniref:ABC transporter permease n=1 Tax=Phytoactinopolyspora endophytica TaxID=1642495 RepID=UPI00101C4E04|nr:ABC transporter permease [Phytoactinopolyspora endophytica]
MWRYVLRRIAYMVPTVFAISVVSFVIIQLPPGDYLTQLASRLRERGEPADQAYLDALSARYGLDEPVPVQYLTWMKGILFHGDFGMSFEWNQPVSALLADTLPFTIALTLGTLLFTWIVAFPIGIYSAVRPYSPGDYLATTIGFIGLAIPNFLLALVLVYLSRLWFGGSFVGVFSSEYAHAPWSVGRFIDLLSHLWIPVIVLGTAGTAGLIRILRANLLDELRRPYVVAGRARGMGERRLLIRYPLRVALNPFVSTIGWVLPMLVSGEVVVGTVLALPTTGPLMLGALRSQDMYLAGSIILVVSVLTVIGTLLSDLVLAWLDPRVRHQYR